MAPRDRSLPQRAILRYLRRSRLGRGKSNLAARIETPKSRGLYAHTTHTGITYNLDLADYVMRQLYLFDTYEANTWRHLRSLLRPDMTFFDVGANIGAYTLPAAQQLKHGRVIAFEPNPPAVALLKRNILSNNFQNIQLVEKAVSDAKSMLTMSNPVLANGEVRNLGAAKASVEVTDGGTTVEATTIDAYCAEKGIAKVDAMKVDVEGFEPAVLDGAEHTIANADHMIVVVEINEQAERNGGSRSVLFKRMIALGFEPNLPTGWPRRRKRISAIPPRYQDNILFLKGRR